MLDPRNKNEAWFKRLRYNTIGLNNTIDLIPEPVVFALASPYLAGTSSLAAIEFAHQQYKQNKLTSTLDILGEHSTNAEECDQAVNKYVELLEVLHAHMLPVSVPTQQITISLKPSTFSTTKPSLPGSCLGVNALTELDKAYSRIELIVDHAQKLKINLTIEAEEHDWTDFQLNTYFALLQKGYQNLGTVLQSRLLRTEQDIKKFDEKMRVRLVIGIYDEPATIALTDKKSMKQQLVEYGLGLAKRGTYVEFATHDARYIEQFISQAVIPLQLTSQKFEFQFLKGVPRRSLQTELATGAYFHKLSNKMLNIGSSSTKEYLAALSNTGATVRLYVPFGAAKSASAYCKRRLKENPSIILYGLKNLLHLQ